MKAAFHIFFEFRRAHRRVLNRQSDVELDAVCGSMPLPDEAFARRQQRAMLDAALDELPLDQRAAFSLFELEELTFSEIAEVLEIPRGTVASRVRRAREAFTLAAHRLARGGFE
jgi:RNA polymerase sigma-70 factor (ECF subfamily)